MKCNILSLALLLLAQGAAAQNFKEPEYIGQVGIMSADSTVTLLPTEKTEVKSKTNKLGLVPVAGLFLSKGQAYMIVKGATSQTTMPSSKVQLVVRVDNNNIDPHKKFGFVKFEVKKKERRFLMAESGFLSGTTSKVNYDDVKYKAEKIGNSSYLVTLENVEPGEYGLIAEDYSYLTTFSVK